MSDFLTFNNVHVSLQKKCILSDVNLSLAEGEILGLVGPSGCGKTTLLNTLAGFNSLENGQILLGNTLLASKEIQLPPEKRKIGMIFQDYALFPHLSVESNICFGIDKLEKSVQKQRLNELLLLLKLEGLAHRFPHQLSGGQQQRVAIARALAPQPKLLLLDEPFSNIDARLRNELMLEMRQLLKGLNITAIFVTHNKDEVFTFADKIAVMQQGNILQKGSPTKVCRSPNNWQVADLLQLGSWLPVQLKQENEEKTKCELHSALGEIDALNVESMIKKITLEESKSNAQWQLLIKPHQLTVCSDEAANTQINHVSVTEQGYHYRLSSLVHSPDLSFAQLSFYSEELFAIGDQLALKVIPHQVSIFTLES